LQLVVSLLTLQARRAASAEARQALRDAADRVLVLAQARARAREHQLALEGAPQQVCVALHTHAEPHALLTSLEVAADTDGLSAVEITTLALVVNELVTNAVKHAFGSAAGGRVSVGGCNEGEGTLLLPIDDDGAAFTHSERKDG